MRSRTFGRLATTATALAVLPLVVGACSSSSSSSSPDTTVAASATTTEAASSTLAAPTIEGVQTYPVTSRNHVEGNVAYPQHPPVGGDHNPVWQNCGYYSKPLADVNAVHSLEHGAVWIAYRPDLPAADVATLKAFTVNQTHVLVSPYLNLTHAVVVSAWGLQLPLDSADDPRLAAFVAQYQQGPQTPEPGAVCSGALGEPE